MEKQFQNPIHIALTDIWHRFKEVLHTTKWTNPALFLSGIVLLLAYSIVLLICCVLWVYGGFIVIVQIFQYLVATQIDAMQEKCSTSIEKFPMLITIGLFSACWLVFVIISLPMYMIGGLSYLFSHSILGKLVVVLLICACIAAYLFRYELLNWFLLNFRSFRTSF